MRLLALLGFALFAGAGACTTGEPASRDDSALQGGVNDTANPAVGLLYFNGGFCTGALIAADLVLTAAHCVDDAMRPIEGFYVGPGKATYGSWDRPAEGFTRHAVAGQVAHPSYAYVKECPFPSADVGLVKLAEPVTDLVPIPVASSAPATAETCIAVGYGLHNRPLDYTYEERRSGTSVVASVSDLFLEVGVGDALADSGDSGGPLLCGGAVAGVVSCHDDGEWPSHKRESYARVDNLRDWIAAQFR